MPGQGRLHEVELLRAGGVQARGAGRPRLPDAKSCAAAFQAYYRCGVIDGGTSDASGDGPVCARAQYMCAVDPDCCKDLRCDQGFCCADLDVACNTAADCCDDGADCIDGTCQIP